MSATTASSLAETIAPQNAQAVRVHQLLHSSTPTGAGLWSRIVAGIMPSGVATPQPPSRIPANTTKTPTLG